MGASCILSISDCVSVLLSVFLSVSLSLFPLFPPSLPLSLYVSLSPPLPPSISLFHALSSYYLCIPAFLAFNLPLFLALFASYCLGYYFLGLILQSLCLAL